MSQPAAMQHLGVLEVAGLLRLDEEDDNAE